MKRYNSVFELEAELLAEGFIKDMDIDIPGDEYTEAQAGCLHDQYGNSLYSYPTHNAFYIHLAKRYMVKTETKGVLFFDELPKNTYFLEGSRNPNEKGLATYYTYDNGTCLIPIIDTTTGLQVIDISRAGKEIK